MLILLFRRKKSVFLIRKYAFSQIFCTEKPNNQKKGFEKTGGEKRIW